MGEQPKTRPVRDVDYYDENVEELLKEYKYLYKAEAKYDITQTLHQYQNLHPKIERCAHTKGGRTEELLTLRGTIPIIFKDATYNIPIQIYTLVTHPKQPPIVFVKPLKNMVLRPSKYMDKSGLVYLRYLVQWKSPRSNTLALCKLLSRAFSEECPVFTEDRLKHNQNPKEQKSLKKKKLRFSSLRRFSMSRKDTGKMPNHHNSPKKQPERGMLATPDKHLQDTGETDEGATAACPSPCDTKSDSSESKSSGKNVSFVHNTTVDEIPDDILDQSLDSMYSSSFESLYSERSVTILAALKNQNIDSNSLFNSSFESLLSDRSVSYLLDLERNWPGRKDRMGLSPQPSLDSNRDRKELLIRSLSLSKREMLKRLSRQSNDSESWPDPPSPPSSPSSPREHEMKKHDSISSENWPAIPCVLQESPTDSWPEPPIDMVIERLATLTSTDKRTTRALSDVKESPFEDSEESLATNSTEVTKFNTWERPDELLLEALRESDSDYLNTFDEDKTPQNKKKIFLTPSDKTFQNEIMKLDFTECEHSLSKETTPRPMSAIIEGGMVKRAEPTENIAARPMAIIEGGMVKRAEPTENKKRWNFWKKSSHSSNNDTHAHYNSICECKPHKKKQSKSGKEDENGEIENETFCTCAANKPQLVHRSQSVDSCFANTDNDHVDHKEVDDHPPKIQGHLFDGGGGMSNGLYERVNLVNGFSHRDHLGKAKIYEPITFGKARTRSENSLYCRYKTIGCTVHTENGNNDSISHPDKSVNHHMDLLLDKVEFLTHEVQNLKYKLKVLGYDE